MRTIYKQIYRIFFFYRPLASMVGVPRYPTIVIESNDDNLRNSDWVRYNVGEGESKLTAFMKASCKGCKTSGVDLSFPATILVCCSFVWKQRGVYEILLQF